MPKAKPVAQMYAEYEHHPGDRERLFRPVPERWPDLERVLYPGSYIDIAASSVFDDVTYVDVDKRAARFFGGRAGVDTLIAEQRGGATGVPPAWRFLHADYLEPFDVPDGSIDLLISMYAGFISPACARYLRPGGLLLANNSHGDASMASLDPGFRLVAVLRKSGERYRLVEDDLEGYLTPRKAGVEVTEAELRRTNRGVRYSQDAAAYVFERASE